MDQLVAMETHWPGSEVHSRLEVQPQWIAALLASQKTGLSLQAGRARGQQLVGAENQQEAKKG